MYSLYYKAERLGLFMAPILIGLLVFFTPISQTLKSIFLVASLLILLATPPYRPFIFAAYNRAPGRAALAFFLFILIASLWSPASSVMKGLVIAKYAKLIYFPILAAGFMSSRLRQWSINAYLAALFITCLISILKSQGLMEGSDVGEVFNNHIITGFMMAFASYLAALMAIQHRGWARGIYLFLVLLTSYQVLFINTGKTGYLVYFILMVLLCLHTLSFKKAIWGVILFSGVLALIYTQSPMMQSRAHEVLSDVKFLKENNQNTSIGYRIQFHRYAQSLFIQYPIAGIGTGGFKHQFTTDNLIPSWGTFLSEPHSQYWMILAEQGLIGFLLWIIFLGSLFFTAFRVKETKPVLLGILVPFCVIAMSDTIFCYSTMGYVLILMSAMSLGEQLELDRLKGNGSRL